MPLTSAPVGAHHLQIGEAADPYDVSMLHELWDEGDDGLTFCLAGPRGDGARAVLRPGARLVWTVEATSHLEAMTAYWAHMGWGRYVSDFPDIDSQTYASRGWE